MCMIWNSTKMFLLKTFFSNITTHYWYASNALMIVDLTNIYDQEDRFV